MRKLFVLSVIILLPVLGFSQQMRDAVHLKNGGLIYGIIIEIIPDETIKIQTADGSIFVYKMDEIEKITKEEIQNNKRSVPKDIIKKGYKGFFGMTKGIGSTDLLQVNTSHGVQINSHLFVGGGFTMIAIEDYNGYLIPIFNARLNVSKRNITPFIDFKIGSGVMDEVGLHINPSVGLRIGGNVLAFNAFLGFVYQEVSSYEGDYSDRYYDKGLSIFCFALAFEF